MAGPQQLKVAPYLLVLTVATVLAYVAVIGLGYSPKLGLDLRGGTSVILTPQVTGGGDPSQDQLDQAVQIIRNRVNGNGVAEAEVTTQGSNIVVNVPNAGRDIVNRVGTTALLAFRPVLQSAAGAPLPATTGIPDPVTGADPSPGAVGSAAPGASASAAPESVGPSAEASPSTAGPAATAAPSATTAGRAAGAALLSAATTTPSAAPSDAASAAPTGDPTATTDPAVSASPSAGPPSGDLVTGSVVTDPSQLAALDCAADGVLEGGSVAAQTENYDEAMIVSCARDGQAKYLLGPVEIQGTEVNDANATFDAQSLQGWTVNLSFTGSGQSKFTDYTRNNVGNQFAIVLDGAVVSAPNINVVIPGDAQISGTFDQKSATDLASILKYGALPLSFSTSQAETISPTLGQDQLDAGLIAGGIGLALVVLYSLLYYRGLGLITIASLLVAAAVTYASVVLLGQAVGFTLTLAGIAGLIVSIGITADSFVVYYERVKDEVREGRQLRSAADRGWLRARRTILNADAVSFLAALILYFLSVGAVRGFAFTLGLTTLVDVAVVFLFTRPVVSLIARSKTFSSPKFTGLGTAHPLAASAGARLPRAATREQRAAAAVSTDSTEG